MSSSTTTALSRQPLREVLKGVEDPRDRRGVRHCLTAVLCLAVVGVLAGCRTLGAMREHVADLEPADLGDLDLEEGRALPSESTIRRVLQRVNADDLDARVSSWLRTRVGAIGGRRVIAVDGKTMRGARGAGERAPHLLAALDQAGGVVVGQRRVADKSNEIPALRDLLEPLDLDGAVITADATAHPEGHGRVDHLPRRPLRAHRQGQPARPEAGAGEAALEGRALHLRPRRLPRAQGAAHRPGRRGARVDRLPRRRPGDPDQTHQNRQGGGSASRWSTRFCSLPMDQAPPELVASWARGHRAIENRLHWIRDVVFDEDRHRLRTGNAPQVIAALRNLAISLIRLLHGPAARIAATTRAMAPRPRRAIDLITRPPR